MRKFWAELVGPPGRQFATDRSLVPYLNVKLAKYYLLTDVGQLRSSITGENVNLDVEFDNAGLTLTQLIQERSPLVDHMRVWQVDNEVVSLVFDGTVYGFNFSALKCTLSLQR